MKLEQNGNKLGSFQRRFSDNHIGKQRCISSDNTVSSSRAFDHDPRFGLVIPTEIASRALSLAVNDPGIAIAVLAAGTRVLAMMLRHDPEHVGTHHDRLNTPAFAFDLIEDLYLPIARDGAGVIEVGIRLQKSLAALQAIEENAQADCRLEAQDALSRAYRGT